MTKNIKQNKQRLISYKTLQAKLIICVGGNDTYGITGIPSTVGGRGVVRGAGLAASTQVVCPGSGREDA